MLLIFSLKINWVAANNHENLSINMLQFTYNFEAIK